MDICSQLHQRADEMDAESQSEVTETAPRIEQSRSGKISGYLSAGSPEPPRRVTLSILSPKSGAVVPARHPVPVMLALGGAQVVPMSTQTFLSPPPADAGHIHILVDGKLTSMQMSGLAEVTLGPGKHTIAAEFVDPYHRSYFPRIIDRVHVTARQDLVGGG
jgi:hypothetical protein